MQLFTNPKRAVMDFDCPYCQKETQITVHEDGVSMCHSCGAEARPPMTYEQAYELLTGYQRPSTTHKG